MRVFVSVRVAFFACYVVVRAYASTCECMQISMRVCAQAHAIVCAKAFPCVCAKTHASVCDGPCECVRRPM